MPTYFILLIELNEAIITTITELMARIQLTTKSKNVTGLSNSYNEEMYPA